MSFSSQPSPIEAGAWLEREAIYDRFEEAWREHGDPDITDFLPAADHAERTWILGELVKIDLEYRWDAGKPRRLEDYLQHYPELRAQGSNWTELVDAEIEARTRHGCPPDATELQQRFPEWFGDRRGRMTSPGNGESVSRSQRRIGRFEVRKELGRGSFATVYLAWDPLLRREVALKAPRAGWLDHPEMRERVQREGQSAARLRHPAIVPLLEVGQDGENAYLVYEYVPGPTLSELLRETRPAPEQAALWVARLGEALDYAHASGIIHRDVKPTNVMMDQDGQPMLADFGLALQADAGATLTRSGDVLGTPAYMSPEQALGRSHAVTASSDVYSLGVVLYQLLCGQLPFQGSGAAILNEVIHEEPPPPRSRQSAIPPDLETICLKAMAKAPGRRYATAAAFAQDLRRFLADEPIEARRTPAIERAWKWRRRHPVIAALAVAAFLAVATIFGVILHANARLEERRLYAEKKQVEAVASLKKAREAVERMLTRVSVERLRGVPQMEVIQQQLLEDALEVYEDLVKTSDSDPSLRLDLARAYEQLGQRYLWIKKLDKAEQCLRQTLALLDVQGVEYAASQDARRLAGAAYFALGTTMGYDNRIREAEEALTRAVAIQEPLVAENPQHLDYRRDLAMMFNAFCYLGTFGDDRKREEETYRKSLRLIEGLVVDQPNNRDYLVKLATLRNNLGNLLTFLGRRAEAEPFYRAGLKLCLECLEREPGEIEFRSKLALLRGNYGSMLTKAGRFEEAEAELLRALKLREEMASEFPTFPHYASELCLVHKNLARVAASQKDDAGERRLLDLAVGHQRKALGLAPKNPIYQQGLADIQAISTEAFLRQGNYQAAAEAAEDIARFPGEKGSNLVLAAELLARCIAMANQDSKIAPEDRSQFAQSFGDAAMRQFREAIRQGWLDVPALFADPKWEPLRARPDWSELRNASRPNK